MVAGIVLAAGAGRRFGRPKAAVELHGTTLVERSARALRAGGCRPVVAVLGAAVVEVPSADVVVVNPGWEDGLGSSLRVGLAAASEAGADQAVVLLCDQPGLGGQVVARLVAEGGIGPGALAMATFDGYRTHPVLLGADHWPAIADLAVGGSGARAYLQRHAATVTEVACDGLGDPTDLDHPDQLARWTG